MKKRVIDKQRLDSLYVAYVDKHRTSRRYFRISYFPRYLHAGKNYIGIKGPSKILYPDSMIHTEILDRAGNPIYHELLDYVHGDGSRVIVAYVYPDTARGAATMWIGGTARQIPERRLYDIPISENPSDDNYKDKPNVKWRRRIYVNPTANNNSKVMFMSSSTNPEGFPVVQIHEVTRPYLQAVHASGSVRVYRKNPYGPTATLELKSPPGVYSWKGTSAFYAYRNYQPWSYYTEGAFKWTDSAQIAVRDLSPRYQPAQLDHILPTGSSYAAVRGKTIMKSQLPLEIFHIDKQPQIRIKNWSLEPDMVGGYLWIYGDKRELASTKFATNNAPGSTVNSFYERNISDNRVTWTAATRANETLYVYPIAHLIEGKTYRASMTVTGYSGNGTSNSLGFSDFMAGGAGLKLGGNGTINGTFVSNGNPVRVFAHSDVACVMSNISVERVDRHGPSINTNNGQIQDADKGYFGVITKVIDEETATIHRSFNYQYTDTDKSVRRAQSFNPTSNWTMSFYQRPWFRTTENSRSYAKVNIFNIHPAVGDVGKINVYSKAIGASGGHIFRHQLRPRWHHRDLLIDETIVSGAKAPDQGLGVIETPSEVRKYWIAKGYGTMAPRISYTRKHLMNSLLIEPNGGGDHDKDLIAYFPLNKINGGLIQRPAFHYDMARTGSNGLIDQNRQQGGRRGVLGGGNLWKHDWNLYTGSISGTPWFASQSNGSFEQLSQNRAYLSDHAPWALRPYGQSLRFVSGYNCTVALKHSIYGVHTAPFWTSGSAQIWFRVDNVKHSRPQVLWQLGGETGCVSLFVTQSQLFANAVYNSSTSWTPANAPTYNHQGAIVSTPIESAQWYRATYVYQQGVNRPYWRDNCGGPSGSGASSGQELVTGGDFATTLIPGYGQTWHQWDFNRSILGDQWSIHGGKAHYNHQSGSGGTSTTNYVGLMQDIAVEAGRLYNVSITATTKGNPNYGSSGAKTKGAPLVVQLGGTAGNEVIHLNQTGVVGTETYTFALTAGNTHLNPNFRIIPGNYGGAFGRWSGSIDDVSVQVASTQVTTDDISTPFSKGAVTSFRQGADWKMADFTSASYENGNLQTYQTLPSASGQSLQWRGEIRSVATFNRSGSGDTNTPLELWADISYVTQSYVSPWPPRMMIGFGQLDGAHTQLGGGSDDPDGYNALSRYYNGAHQFYFESNDVWPYEGRANQGQTTDVVGLDSNATKLRIAIQPHTGSKGARYRLWNRESGALILDQDTSGSSTAKSSSNLDVGVWTLQNHPTMNIENIQVAPAGGHLELFVNGESKGVDSVHRARPGYNYDPVPIIFGNKGGLGNSYDGVTLSTGFNDVTKVTGDDSSGTAGPFHLTGSIDDFKFWHKSVLSPQEIKDSYYQGYKEERVDGWPYVEDLSINKYHSNPTYEGIVGVPRGYYQEFSSSAGFGNPGRAPYHASGSATVVSGSDMEDISLAGLDGAIDLAIDPAPNTYDVGTSTYIRMDAMSQSLFPGMDISVSWWQKKKGTGSGAPWGMYSKGGGNRFAVFQDHASNDDNEMRLHVGSGGYADVTMAVDVTGTWVHFVITVENGEKPKLYTNGVFTEEFNFTADTSTAFGDVAFINLGGDLDDTTGAISNQYVGELAQWRCYKRILTPAEINILYGNPTNKFKTKDDYVSVELTGSQSKKVYSPGSYFIEMDARCFPLASTISEQIPHPRIDVYMSGSAFQPKVSKGVTAPSWFVDNVELGKHIGTIEGKSGSRFDNIQAHFEADRTGNAIPIFVVRSGTWQIANIHLLPSKLRGMSPHHVEALVPVPVDHNNEPQEFMIRYFNYRSRPARHRTFVGGVVFTGGNTFINGNNNLLTGSMFISNNTGTGIVMSGQSSGIIKSVGYYGFASGSTNDTTTSGFMIWSGSDKLVTEDNTLYKGVGIEMVSDADNFMKFSASADTSNVIDMSSYRFKFGSGSTAFISSSGDGKMYISSSKFEVTSESDIIMKDKLQLKGTAFVMTSSLDAKLYFSQSAGIGRIGINTENPTTDFDVRAEEFQFQRKGARKGMRINEDGDIESFNKDAASSTTGSEFVLSYQPGGKGALTKNQMATAYFNLTGTPIVETEEVITDVYGNSPSAFFDSLDAETQSSILLVSEKLGFFGTANVGDIVGSIRYTVGSGSAASSSKISRTIGEAASIKTSVTAIADDGGVQAKLQLNVAKVTGAPTTTYLEMDGATGFIIASQSMKFDNNANLNMNGNDILNVGTLQAQTFNTSIVSSSIAFSSGSNIFGDAVGDTHTFTGHITASNNISSSGTITTNTITAASIETNESITVNSGHIKLYGSTAARQNISASGDLVLGAQGYQFTNDEIYAMGAPEFMRINGDTNILGNVTASGDISGSSINIYAGRFYQGATNIASIYSPIQGSENINTIGTIENGTWLGDAIASAHLDADTAHLTTNQTFTGIKTFSHTSGSIFTTPITASIISASGDIHGSSILTNNIFHEGDDDTKIIFGDNSLRFTVGNVISQNINTYGIDWQTPVTASSDISASGHIYGNRIVGIGQASFGSIGKVITGQITASGAISSSGNIHAIDYFDNGVNINTLYDLTPGGTYSSSLQTLTNITASGDISSSGNVTALSASINKLEVSDINIVGRRHVLFNRGIYINDNPLLVDNGYFGSSISNTPSNWNDPTPASFDSSAGTFESVVDITEDEHGSKVFHAPFPISRIEVLSSWRTAGTGANEKFWCGIWTGSAGVRLGVTSSAHNTVKNIGFVTGSIHEFYNAGDWNGHNNDLDFTFTTPLPAFTQIYYGMGTGEASSVGTKNIRGYITMMVYEA